MGSDNHGGFGDAQIGLLRAHNLRHLFERFAEGILHTNQDDVIVFANRKLCNMTGYLPQELEGYRIDLILPGKQCHDIPQGRQSKIEKSFSQEIQLKKKCGTEILVEVTCAAMVTDKGDITGAIYLIQDTSERTRREIQSEAFTQLGQNLNSASSLKEAAKVTLDVADRLFGWDSCTVDLFTPEQDTIQPILNIDTVDGRRVDVAAAYSGKPRPILKSILEQGPRLIEGENPIDVPLVRFGNTARPSASRMFVPIRRGNRTIGVLSIQSYTPAAYDQRDLASFQALADYCGGAFERLLTEEALRAREQHFRSLIENALDSIAILNPNGEIVYYGPSSERVIGWDPEDFEGKNAFDFIHPEDLADMKNVFQEMLEHAGEIRTAEYRFLHKDGSWHVVESIGKSLLDEAGNSRVIVNSRDITDRKKLEEQLRQAQKMETIGRLAAGVAHDCNNILMAIRTYSELLELKLNQKNQFFQEIDEIKKVTEQGAALTRKLLAFGRKQRIAPKILDLNEILVEDCDMLTSVIGENIVLNLVLNKNLNKVNVDRAMIQQAILNLCVNARDAMPDGGQIDIRTENLMLDEAFVSSHVGARSGEFVLLEIADNGCGMNEQTLSRIFEPFFTTKDVGKGVGLGLSSTYGTVKQSDGYICCESQPGKGTTFRIYLPRA